MRFRVKNIQPGYCDVWANERDGERYQKFAVVKRLDGGWRWRSVDYHVLPEVNDDIQTTRRECIADCERTTLIRQMERAIERQPKESKHWHSSRRDALADMERSYLFTRNELEQWTKRAYVFEVVGA